MGTVVFHRSQIFQLLAPCSCWLKTPVLGFSRKSTVARAIVTVRLARTGRRLNHHNYLHILDLNLFLDIILAKRAAPHQSDDRSPPPTASLEVMTKNLGRRPKSKFLESSLPAL